MSCYLCCSRCCVLRYWCSWCLLGGVALGVVTGDVIGVGIGVSIGVVICVLCVLSFASGVDVVVCCCVLVVFVLCVVMLFIDAI